MAGPSSSGALDIRNGTGSRKRERVDQEDDLEFMPLSKRINNIHLSPERIINGNVSHASNSNNQADHQNGVLHNLGFQNHPESHPSHRFPNGYPQDLYASGFELASHNVFNGGQEVASRVPTEYTAAGGNLCILPNMRSSVPENNLNHHQNSQIPNVLIQSPDLGREGVVSSIQYRPSLNQSANPHYYESNRALFNLYIERQLRNNQAPHPNVFQRTPNINTSSNNTL